MLTPLEKKKYRSLFLSDLHLGTRLARAEELNNYLKTVEVDNIFLLGDIVDVQAIKRRLYWDPHHNAVIKRFFKMAQDGTNITYITGNHDRDMMGLKGLDFSGITIKKQTIHTTNQNKKYLLMHGDKFDGVLNEKMMFLYALGDHCYTLAVMLNYPINLLINLFGIEWSLSNYLKSKVKNVVQFISNFEKLVSREAFGIADGVICGHIHTASHQCFEGIDYFNCGCWTESASVVVENMDGSLELLILKKV